MLRRAALVLEPNPADPGSVDAHPLVREYFGEEARCAFPEGWRMANERLYRHLVDSTSEFPDTLEEMAPLYAAVTHGREAGYAEEAISRVYDRRIQRGGEFYAVRSLGSAAIDLGCLSGFFTTRWRRIKPEVPEEMQARLFNRVGFCLRAVGRLPEAAEATAAAAALRAARGDWKDAVLNATNLAELNVLTGELRQARKNAEQSFAYAERSDDPLAAIVSRATLGFVLHQLGEGRRALELFAEAEEREAARGFRFNILYSLRGFQYCDLLVDTGAVDEAARRARITIGWAEEMRNLLDMGLGCLVLARGALHRNHWEDALAESRKALDLLQQADSIHHTARAYLVRAQAHRAVAAVEEAEHLLTLARRHASRAGLRLHLADCDLEAAWLCSLRGDIKGAVSYLAAADSVVRASSFGRRSGEVQRLKELVTSLEPSTA